MANRYFNQFTYSLHKFPVWLNCDFVVDSTNGNGLGLRSLKGKGIQAVYMHTSATPAALNPNPPAGFAYVQLQDHYNLSYGGFFGAVSPVSGTPILVASAGVVASTVYIITAVGTTTTAGWVSLGLPIGVTPAVGAPFIATATATATGTGAVEVPAVNGSGVPYVESIGDSNTTLAPTGSGAAYPYQIIRFMGPTSSSVTTPIATAPADGSVVSFKFYLSNSSV